MISIESLESLEEDVAKCKMCPLQHSQTHLPEWSINSKYLAVFDCPKPDTQHDKFLWSEFEKLGIYRDEFLIIHTVQCSTGYNKRFKRMNKPAKFHRHKCKPWVEEYINIIKPEKGICFGNIAMEMLTGKFSGINEKNSTLTDIRFGDIVIPFVISISPDALTFSGSLNQERLIQSLTKFGSL